MAFATSEPVEQEAVCGFGVEWRAGELKPQESANTAWAFATVNQSERRAKDFKPQYKHMAGVAEQSVRECRFKLQGACQHGMGVCNGEASEGEAIRIIGGHCGAAA